MNTVGRITQLSTTATALPKSAASPASDLPQALDLLQEMARACAAACRVISRTRDELMLDAFDAELTAAGVQKGFDKRASEFLKDHSRTV